MCFAAPFKVKKVMGKKAVTESGRTIRVGKLHLKTGDYVLVYADLAIEKVEKKQAIYTRKLIRDGAPRTNVRDTSQCPGWANITYQSTNSPPG